MLPEFKAECQVVDLCRRTGKQPADPELVALLKALEAAREQEKQTMVYGKLNAPADGPGEGPNKYGVCCDRSKGCDCNGQPSNSEV